MKIGKDQIEAEFNAGVTYAETLAVFMREASRSSIELKLSMGNQQEMVRLIALIKEMWAYIRPYRKENMKDLLGDIEKLESEVIFKTIKTRGTVKEKIRQLDEIKSLIHVNAVLSGLIPFRRKLTPSSKLKEALLE